MTTNEQGCPNANAVGCCTITWTFRPGSKLSPQQRAAMAPDILRQIKDAGYTGAEIGMNVEDLGGVEGVRRLAEEVGLAVIRINSRAPLHDGLAAMKQLGAACVMAGTPARRTFPNGKPTPDAFRKISRDLEEQAKLSLEEFGLPTALHNHMGTVAESREEIDRLFDGTTHLRLLLDIAHLRASGGDPIAAIRDYGDRIADVHVKDWDSTLYCEQPFHPGFVELGKGNCGLDVAGCLAALRDVGYTGWLTVEQDLSETPFESNRHNRRYLRALGC